MENPKPVKVTEAIQTGLSLRSATFQVKAELRFFLLKEINRACEMISAKITINSDDELQMCLESILEENPMIKVEEVRGVFNKMIKGNYGKYFERFKTAEILNCFNLYNGEERAIALENINRGHVKRSEEEMDQTAKSLEGYKHKPQYLSKTLRDRLTGKGDKTRKTISDLKKQILTKEEIEIING